ncbi:MAG: glutathione S-transferase [Planctomycetota bacterium]|jgi:glutathione S-transferase
MKLVIGNKNYSSWSLRAWFMLSAYNIPFEEIRVPLYAKDSTRSLIEYSAAAKVPVLQDNDAIIWDSLAICEYVSEQYLAGKGWPEDVMTRAEARSCSAEMHSSFFALRNLMPMNCRASNRKVDTSAELEKDIRRIDAMWSELRDKHTNIGPWLFGKFSIADCMYAPVVMRFATYNVLVSDASNDYISTLKAHSKIQTWLEQAKLETETIESEEVGM